MTLAASSPGRHTASVVRTTHAGHSDKKVVGASLVGGCSASLPASRQSLLNAASSACAAAAVDAMGAAAANAASSAAAADGSGAHGGGAAARPRRSMPSCENRAGASIIR